MVRTALRLLLLLLLASCGGAGDDGTEPAESTRARTMAIAAPAQARWGVPVHLPLVPAAAANQPDGTVVLWAADDRFYFSNSGPGRTYTSVFDPVAGSATDRLVTESSHNMFCPGTTNLPDGRLLVNGGLESAATSLYDPATGAWTASARMNVPRGYNANTLLADGSVLTIGGSWSGNQGYRKNAERWTEAGGWQVLANVNADALSGNDPAGRYRADNHMWLIPAPDGRVLQAGPSADMHWIDVRGHGDVRPAGRRSDDAYAMNGNVVAYDAGKVLKVGGAPAYENAEATSSAYRIDLAGGGAAVTKLAPMTYRRAFHNSVVLPNGQVIVIGGQTRPVPFSDDNAILVPELWDPATQLFTPLPPMATPRTYHSWALLLPDARVVAGGGGLCGTGCATNHPDLEILTPHYLLNADGTPATRPVITAAPATAAWGRTLSFTTGGPIASAALVRLSSATHSINNDQRRVALAPRAMGGNRYDVDIPSNPNVLLPGAYMLFAMDAAGVPSMAARITVGAAGAPVLPTQEPRIDVVGTALAAPMAAGGSGLGFAATGLPPGLAIHPSTGVVSGTPTTPGIYRVTVSAGNAAATVSVEFGWTIEAVGAGPVPGTTRFVKLEQLTEAYGHEWATIAEFNLLDRDGRVLDRGTWRVDADSVETAVGDGDASKAIDGNATTFWSTQYTDAVPAPPHAFVVSLGRGVTLGAFRVLPRQDGGTNGMIAQYRFYASSDGVNWGAPLAQGNLGDLGPLISEKTVYLAGATNRLPTIVTPGAQSSLQGRALSLSIGAADVDGDALTFTATGLPPGLSIDAATGVVSGTPTAAGAYTATVGVADGRGGSATMSFAWTITGGSPTGGPARYVRLEALSEVNGGPWTSMAEFNVIDAQGAVVPRAGWRATADSEDPDNPAAGAIDGAAGTLWHTRWSGVVPPPPHAYTVDLGATVDVSGFRYLPRQDSSTNGTIAQYRFYLSRDGIDWGVPVAQGDLRNLGGARDVKTVNFGSAGGTPPANRAPVVTPPADVATVRGQSASVSIAASDPDGDSLAYAATGLPPGVSIGATTGIAAGVPGASGRFAVTVTVTDARGAATPAAFAWTVTEPAGGGGAVRFARFEQVSEVNGNPWASVGEFNLLDADGNVLPRTGWVARADSADAADPATSAIDGVPGTLWHTQWNGASPPPPHALTVDLGTSRTVGGFRYLPRQDGSVNGTFAAYRFYLSADGVNWGAPVVEGDFRPYAGGVTSEKTVMLPGATGNRAPTITTPAAQSGSVGQVVSLAISAQDADGDALSFSATGLPPGLAIDPASGRIGGTLSGTATASVVVTVSDGRGGSAVAPFAWTVVDPAGTPVTAARYVRLEQLTEVNGNPWGSAGEFNLIDASGATVPRTGWVVSADSADVSDLPANAIDGDAMTLWHTRWNGASPPPPHQLTVDLGSTRNLKGFRYLPRQDGSVNGTFAQYRFYLSSDGVNWGAPVAAGDFRTLGATTAEKTVIFAP